MAYSDSRVVRLAGFILVIYCLLVGRLVFLQLVEGARLTSLALSGRIEDIPVGVPRGDILDRNGIPLTDTLVGFSLVLFPEQIQDIRRTAAALAEVAELDASRIESVSRAGGRPVKVTTGLDALRAQRINRCGLPGVLAVPETTRYGSGSLASHVIGYINRSDNHGVSGVEERFDELLRGGEESCVAALVDAGRQLIPGLGYKRIRLAEGASPSNATLTIDIRLQKIVETSLDEVARRGAVVVLQPKTGEILAMASRPNFDGDRIADILNQDGAPLLNRAVTAFQPGSVFKLVVAAAALEEKLVSPAEQFFDRGYVEVEGIRFKGWDYEKGPRGWIRFREAMAYSSNPVFIETGLRLGALRLTDYARRMGFGRRTCLDLEEEEGNIPPPEEIFPGDLANVSIGQGRVEATPLQVACLVAAIASDGIRPEPHLVSRLSDDSGRVIKTFPAVPGARIMSRKTAEELRRMMEAVTRYGTGQAAYVSGWGSAGKTGSAETGRTGERGQGINHAWFAGYVPLEQPQYVVVVFIEDGMSGGDVAAPLFHDIAVRMLESG